MNRNRPDNLCLKLFGPSALCFLSIIAVAHAQDNPFALEMEFGDAVRRGNLADAERIITANPALVTDVIDGYPPLYQAAMDQHVLPRGIS